MDISGLRNFASNEGVFVLGVIIVFFVIKYLKNQDWFKFISTILMGGAIMLILTGGDIMSPVRWLLGLFGINL